MFAARPEKNRYRESDDCSETNPPGKFHYREPARLRVELCAKDIREAIGKPAQDCDDDEADDHGDDVAEIVATSLSEHSAEKYT